MLGISSDERFLAVARHRLVHLFPALPTRDAFHKRRLRLAGTIEALIAEFARHSPGFYDDLLLVDSTPVACARSIETTRRSQLADYGYCASHSRFFWGFRLHALFALDGTPSALALTSPKLDEKSICLQLVARCERQPGQMLILIGDKNFRGTQLEADLAALDAQILPPRRKDEKGPGPHLAPIRQRIESIFWTAKDIPRSRTPRRTHPAQPVRAHGHALRRARRRSLAQPPTRSPHPLDRLLHHLNPWHKSSRG
jgi:Transposase DDE domain